MYSGYGDLTARYGIDFIQEAPMDGYGCVSLRDIEAVERKKMTIELECSNGIVERYWISNGEITYGFERRGKEFEIFYAGPVPELKVVCDSCTSTMLKEMTAVDKVKSGAHRL